MSIKKAIFDTKNILVVGGAGFIGSHLCDELVKKNKVICLDNFSTGERDNIAHLLSNPNFKLINHDINNAIELEKQVELKDFKVEFQGVQEIYYLASPASPKAYADKPVETLLANSVGLRNALDMAVKYQSQFIFASAPAVYGEISSDKPIKENQLGIIDQLGERACFSEAKRFGETLTATYRKVYNLDAKIARIFNCYGTRMKLDDGRISPEMVKAATSAKDLVIYGDEKSWGSYFYVTDLIKALMKLMESTEVGPINLASDWKVTFKEIAEKIIAISDSKSKITFEKRPSSLGDQLLGDITLAKEKLGWFPIILLDEGLKETIDYMSAQHGVLEPGQQNN